MNIDLREELRKRDELLDGYLKQIEIQEEFIQKQKEMIEFLEDHISKRSRTAGKRPEGNPEASQAIRDTAAKNRSRPGRQSFSRLRK